MPTEKLEIDIIAKGKPAEKAIGNVEKKTDDLGKTTKRVGDDTDGMLSRLRAGWVAVGATIALSTNEAVQFERASVGLSREMRQFAKDTALSSQATAEQIAGFLKSAQTAGLADEQMKKLATDAIALGYAFPHEDAETLHDNLVMLNTTGEAQGFIVDILEQQYAKMGKQFDEIDLKAVSLEEKLTLVNNVIEDSQQAMETSALAEYDRMMGQLDNTATQLGETLIQIGAESGAFGLFKNILAGADLLLSRVSLGILKLKDLFADTDESRIAFLEQALIVLKKDSELANFGAFGDNKQKIEEYTRELQNLKGTQDSVNASVSKSSEELEMNMSIWEKVRQSAEEFYYGTEVGFKRYIKQVQDATRKQEDLANVGYQVARGIEDAFVNMAMGAKASFKDMANAIVADLIRIQIRRSVVLPLLGLFHTGTAEVKHTGGTIGGIPSYHTGMRSDERLAKLQVGEAVVNRAGASRNRNAIDAMNAGYQVGGGTGNVTTAEINFNVQAIDASSFNNYLVGNKHTIENIINNSLQTNGTVRRTIKQVI